ncbi:ELL-associated factor 2-like [Artemia franciscana]|uniref:ELL-associated factor 2-like n=1 Tax=Artemia franciscana TaxID=6661 RepID=UPI0032DA5205
MVDKLGLSNEIKELKLGSSFYKKDSPFHTVKYDFKPASVDTSQMADLEIGTSNEVSVTVPHLEGSGTTHTVFKGSKRPYTKECILIIDHKTGEITLERLGVNVQLKKTRAEGSSKINRPMPSMDILAGTKKLQAKQHSHKEAQKHRKISPPRISPTQKNGVIKPPSTSRANSSRGSLKPSKPPSCMPALVLTEDLDSPAQADANQNSAQSVGLMLTDSSSDSGSSSSSESSDSEDPDMEPVPEALPPTSQTGILRTSPVKSQTPPLAPKIQRGLGGTSGHLGTHKGKNASLSSSLLSDDLHLSESGSDSD